MRKHIAKPMPQSRQQRIYNGPQRTSLCLVCGKPITRQHERGGHGYWLHDR